MFKRNAWASIMALCVCSLALCISQASAQDNTVLNQYYGNGVHAYFSGNYAEAYDLLSKPIEANIQDPRPYYFRGFALMELGRPEQAEKDFKAGAELELKDTTGRFPVNFALERCQGAARIALEKARNEVQLAAFKRRAQYTGNLYGGQTDLPPTIIPEDSEVGISTLDIPDAGTEDVDVGTDEPADTNDSLFDTDNADEPDVLDVDTDNADEPADTLDTDTPAEPAADPFEADDEPADTLDTDTPAEPADNDSPFDFGDDNDNDNDSSPLDVDSEADEPAPVADDSDPFNDADNDNEQTNDADMPADTNDNEQTNDADIPADTNDAEQVNDADNDADAAADDDSDPFAEETPEETKDAEPLRDANLDDDAADDAAGDAADDAAPAADEEEDPFDF